MGGKSSKAAKLPKENKNKGGSKASDVVSEDHASRKDSGVELPANSAALNTQHSTVSNAPSIQENEASKKSSGQVLSI